MKEIDKRELEAHYTSFMAKIQEVLPAESSSTDTPLEQCKTNLDETNSALGRAIICRDSFVLIALQNKQKEFEKYKAFNAGND
ncbi:hypothetical protein Tco_0798571 [Tanacetum coccineum]